MTSRTVLSIAVALGALGGLSAGGFLYQKGKGPEPRAASELAPPPQPDAGLLRGLALWRDGRLDEAIQELQHASDTLADPALQAEAAYDLSEALLAAHRRQEARAVAGKYLALEKRPGQDARIARAREIAH